MKEENGINRTDRTKNRSDAAPSRGRLRLFAAAGVAALLLANAVIPAAFAYGSAEQTAAGQIVSAPAEEIDTSALTFDVNRFVLPSDAKSLIAVEGFAVKSGKSVYQTGTSDQSLWNRARVTVFERNADGSWSAKVQSAGVYGWGGMSNQRHSGDGTTPIGLWKVDTPFGRKDAEEGFPSDYVKIDTAARSQYWSDVTNRLETNADAGAQSGERLYADWAEGIYDYCLNSGFNLNNAQKGTGTALFLHCTVSDKPSTAGCVAIDPEAMKAVLRIEAKGGCYIAQAPEGQFDSVYAAFSATGASAPGNFTTPAESMPETATVILQ